jgi:hypothetical protein
MSGAIRRRSSIVLHVKFFTSAPPRLYDQDEAKAQETIVFLYFRNEETSLPVLPESITIVFPSGSAMTAASPWPTSRNVTLRGFFSISDMDRKMTNGRNGIMSRYLFFLNRK